MTFYLDEDAMQHGLVQALRARRIDVTTALEAGMVNRSDEDQLLWATHNRRVIYTFNIADFYELHHRWIRNGRLHSGIILAPQRRFSIGEQTRRLLLLAASRQSMQGRIEYLSSWR